MGFSCYYFVAFVCVAIAISYNITKISESDLEEIEFDRNIVDHELEIIDKDCQNREPDADCDQWASEGACDLFLNQGWMSVVCARSCGRCHLVNYERRCARSRFGNRPSVFNHTMDKVFDGIIERAKAKYQPKRLSETPHLLELNDFVSPTEIEALLTTAGNHFQRSQEAQAQKLSASGEQAKITSNRRFSLSAKCLFSNGCRGHPAVEKLIERIENITGIPQNYYEDIQLIKYTKGMFYQTHHDMSEKDNKLSCGPRVFTFFMYLNDVVSGGGTNFPKITSATNTNGITVQPKAGNVAIWPSVLDENVHRRDNLTFHQALEVEEGVKYAANIWIRLYDHSNSSRWGCTGNEF